MKQPGNDTIKDGVHEFGVMGKKKVMKGQMFCEDSLVVMRE